MHFSLHIIIEQSPEKKKMAALTLSTKFDVIFVKLMRCALGVCNF